MHGACLVADEVDAGRADATSTAEPTVSADDFDDLSSEVPWTEPIVLPRPEVAFTGADDDRIVGTWIELGCDPSVSALDGVGGEWPRDEGCLRLVIERAASGQVTGILSFDRTYDLLGPFAPAIDPNVGYPTELDVSQYFALTSWQPQVPYRMLDGDFQDGRLTFWSSSMDLWHQWCSLQTPYPWDAAGHIIHACVPQDAESQTTIDDGKIILCRSPELEPLCGPPGGPVQPCNCVNDISTDPACVGGYCRCDATGCDANVQRAPLTAELTLDGERLSGGARSADGIDYVLVLEREAP